MIAVQWILCCHIGFMFERNVDYFDFIPPFNNVILAEVANTFESLTIRDKRSKNFNTILKFLHLGLICLQQILSYVDKKMFYIARSYLI